MALIKNPDITIKSEVEVHCDEATGDVTKLVTYIFNNDEDAPKLNTNIAIASYVTAYGRLELLKLMNRIEGPTNTLPAKRVLYFDTDSAIFIQRPGDPHEKRGNFLGELTDEILDFTGDDKAKCHKFLCLGPKSYLLEINYPDGRKASIIKCKGINLNQVAKQQVKDNQERLVLEHCDLITNGTESTPLRVPQFNIVADKHEQVPTTKYMEKLLRGTGNKRSFIREEWLMKTLGSDYYTLPYGFNLALEQVELHASENNCTLAEAARILNMPSDYFKYL
jgi:hypothetical protein